MPKRGKSGKSMMHGTPEQKLRSLSEPYKGGRQRMFPGKVSPTRDSRTHGGYTGQYITKGKKGK